MGLTYEQCKQLGIEHLHPLHSGLAEQAERSRAVREDLDLAPEKPQRIRPADGMNKTERAFAETLEAARARGNCLRWWREPLRVRLAGKCFYTPDFVVQWTVGTLWVVEVKGPYAREDSIIKLKTAASMYPCFNWLIVRRDGRHGWDVREVTRAGIEVHPITVPWIGGC
jgi:hypothetical protein